MSDSEGKKAYHHGDLRQALLTEAAALLREEGEDALSMRRLAARAGVSRTAPYHHFRDKQDLLCAIAEEGFRLFGESLARAYDGSAPLRQQLRGFVDSYVEFAVSHPEYYDLMFGGRLWQSDSVTPGLVNEGHGSFRGHIEQVRRWQQAAGVSDGPDPLRVAQVTWSTLHGMSRMLIDGIYVDRGAIDSISATAADMFWRELHPA